MTRRYPLHRRTLAILASLEKELGVSIPALECFCHIADLDEKVRRCFEPAEIEHIEILDQPIRAGNCDFYALSMEAVDWYEEFLRSFPNAPKMHEAGWLYASAHSMKPDVLAKAWPEKEKLGWEVFRWRSTCGVKPEQVDLIRRAVNPEIPWPEAEKADEGCERNGYAGNGWMVSELCKLKQDPDFWRKGCPMIRAVQEYRNCSLYAGDDAELRNIRWERWKASACMDEQKAVLRLREWLVANREKISAAPKADGPAKTQAPPVREAVSGHETKGGEKSAIQSGWASISPTMAQDGSEGFVATEAGPEPCDAPGADVEANP